MRKLRGFCPPSISTGQNLPQAAVQNSVTEVAEWEAEALGDEC